MAKRRKIPQAWEEKREARSKKKGRVRYMNQNGANQYTTKRTSHLPMALYKKDTVLTTSSESVP